MLKFGGWRRFEFYWCFLQILPPRPRQIWTNSSWYENNCAGVRGFCRFNCLQNARHSRNRTDHQMKGMMSLWEDSTLHHQVTWMLFCLKLIMKMAVIIAKTHGLDDWLIGIFLEELSCFWLKCVEICGTSADPGNPHCASWTFSELKAGRMFLKYMWK